MSPDEKLTLKLRIKICWSVLTTRTKHKHPTQVKSLDLFQAGYSCGFYDAMPKLKQKPIFNYEIKS